MRINKVLLFLFLTSFCLFNELIGSHIVGGTLEYMRLGPGSLPNSSRYKVKLKIYRNDSAGSVNLNPRAIIYVRGDARFPFNPALSPDASTLGSRYDDPNVFSRDFAITPGSYLDTLTVRQGAMTGQPISDNNFFLTSGWGSEFYFHRVTNTSITGASSGLGYPGYEYSAYTTLGMNYPAAQFMADRNLTSTGFGFLKTYKVVDNSKAIDTCTNVVSNSIEIYEFTRVIDLPNIPGGFHMYFEISARNAGVKNINNPGGTGFTLYTRIPDFAVLDPDPDSYTKLYQAYATISGANTIPGFGTVLGLGNAFTFAGLNASNGTNGGYLNDKISSLSLTGIVKTMQNSSPRFLNRPPSFVCTQSQSLINLGINQNKAGAFFTSYDNDGDSLVYEVVSASTVQSNGNNNDPPFTSTSQWRGTPAATVNGTFFNTGSKLFPTLPFNVANSGLDYPLNVNIATFKYVSYTSFTGSGLINSQYPLGLIGTLPGIVIDPKTGQTNFNPPIAARMVTSIRVREFRRIDDDGNAGTPLKMAFLGQINTDYQFVVRNCPLPSLAYMASTIGCFKPKSSAVPLQFAPPDPTKDATTSWFWDTGIDRYTVTGIKNLTSPGLSTEKIDRIDPSGSIVINSTIGGISSPAFYKTGKNTTYSFPGVGSYFVKLVVQLNSNNVGRTTCSDSAYTTVHVSELKSGFTVTGGPICVGTPIVFDPFATGLGGTLPGFVTTSGASLYTSLATNPFPKVVKKQLDAAGNILYTFLGTAFWMQPNGTRDAIEPDPSIIAPSKILYLKYAFGDGTTQEFFRTMATNIWTGIPALGVAGAKTTVTGFYGPQSIPGVSYTYASAGKNIKPYLLVRNQFGCQDSVIRNVTVVSALPTAQILTQSICQNVTTVTIQGFVTSANKGIWSGGLGGYFPAAAGNTISGVATVIGIGASTTSGFLLSSIYKPTALELAVAPSTIPLMLSTTGIVECPIGVTTTAGIPVTPQPFVDAGLPQVLLCKNNLQYALNATVSGASITGLWTIASGTGTFVSTGANTSTGLSDTFVFSTTAGVNVVLKLSATNIGSCLPVSDVITLTSDALKPIPVINAANVFTVNGIKNALSVCANNSVFTIAGTVTFAGFTGGGSWTSLSTSPGSGFTSSVTIVGIEAWKISYAYTPSPAEIATGYVDLQLTTDVQPSATNCSNVSRTVRVNITESPKIDVILTNLTSSNPNVVNVCLNNPLVTISGTVTGSGGFNLTVGSGIVSRLSTITGTVSGLNGVVRNYFASSFLYTPSAAEKANTTAVLLPVNLTSTSNGNCAAASSTASLKLIPPPIALITFGGALLDSISLCNNNPSAFFGSIFPRGPILTPENELKWYSSGNGSFSTPNGKKTTNYFASPTDTSGGNVRIILEANNATDRCLSTYDTVKVKFFNSPKILPGSDLTLCNNFLVGTLSGTVSTPASGGIWSTSGDGYFGNNLSAATTTVLSAIYNASANDLANGNVNLTLSSSGATIGTASGQCLQKSSSISVGFQPVPDINFGVVPVVNENNSIINLTATVTGPNVTPTTSAIWGSALNNNAASYDPSRTNFIYLAGSQALNGAVKYAPDSAEIAQRFVDMSITVSGANNCLPNKNTIKVPIFPQPTATILSKPLTVCANNNTMNLTSTVTGAAGGIWSGGDNAITAPAPGFSATYVPSTNEINQGFVKLFFTTTGEYNNANSVRDSIKANISPPPSAKIGLSSMSVCGNALSGFFPGTVSGSGSFGFVWTTSGTGQFFNGGVLVNGSIAGSNALIEYRPSAADKVAAGPTKLTLITAGNGGCFAAFDIANMYFTPSPVANAGADNTWCLNDPTPIQLNASGTQGAWSSSRLGGKFTSTGNNASTSFSDTYNPTTSVTETITFTWTTNASTGCRSVSDAVTITVLSSPVITLDKPLDTVCGNSSSLDLNSTLTGGVGTSTLTGMKWTTGPTGGYFTSSSPANTQIGKSIYGSSVTDTYVFSAADKLAGFVNLTVTSFGTNPCYSVSAVKRITITPEITANAGTDLELCSTQNIISLTGNVLANGVPDNTRNGVWSVVGAGMGSFSNPNTRITVFTASLSAINPPNQKVTLVFLPTIAGGCMASQPSDTVVYTFRAAPKLGITSSPIQVCSDTSFIQLNASFTGTAGIIWSTTGTNTSLNWVSSNNSAIVSNTTITSSTNVKYVPSATDLSQPSLGFIVSANGSGVCANISSALFTVTVNSKPLVVLAGPSTVCDNQSLISLTGTNMSITSITGVARPTVSWYKFISGVPNNVGFNFPTTITTNNVGTVTTYSPTSSDRTNGFVTLFVSITGPNTCKAQTLSKVVSFTPSPTVAVGSASTNLCSNLSAITLTGTTVNSTLAGWSLTTTIAGVGSFSGINSLTAVFIPSALGRTLTALGFRFTTSLLGCNDVFADKAIQLTPAPVVTIPSSFGPYCGDNSVVTLTGAFSSTSSASLSTSFGGIFSPNNQAYLPIIYQPQNSSIVNSYNNGTSITVTITSLNNGVCNATSAVTSFLFTPPPTISGGGYELLCSSTNSIILSSATGVSASPGVLGFKWTTSANSTISGGAGIFTFTGLTTSTGLSQVYLPGNVEKTGSTILTIYTTSIAGGCSNISAQKQVDYSKAPTFASLPNQVRCSNNALLSFNAVATDYASIQWTSSSANQTGGGLFLDNFAISPQYSPGQLDINNKAVTITGTVLGFGACGNTPLIQSFVLSITSAPVITVVSPINICSEVTTVQLSAISNYTNTGFSWANLTSSVSGTFAVNQFVASPIYSISANDIANQGATLRVTGTYGSCAPTTVDVGLYIVPKPTINAGSNYALCGDVTSDKIRLTFTGENFTEGQWTGGKGNFGNPAIDRAYVAPGSAGSPGYVDYFPNSLDSLLGAINLKVTSIDQSGLCAAATDFLTITLVSPPSISAGNSADYCATIGVITLSGSISGPETYLYQWVGLSGNTGTGSFTGSNNVSGIQKTITGTGAATDQYTLGTLYENQFRFALNVVGTGVCKLSTYSPKQVNFGLQQPPAAIFTTGNFSVCADAIDITVTGFTQYSTVLGQVLSPFFTATNKNGVPSGSDQYKPSQVPPYAYEPISAGFYSTLMYRVFPSDITAGGVNFKMDVQHSTICPASPALSTVTIVSAPIVSVSGPNLGCSNNAVITVVGYSSTGAGTWSAATAVPSKGFFISQSTITSGSNTSILGVYSISGDEFDNKSVNLLFKSGANGLCNQVSAPLSIPLKYKPTVDAGSDGTVCNLNVLSLTGTISDPVTASGTSYGWRIVSKSAALASAFLTSSGSTSGVNVINTITGVNIQLVSTAFNPNGSSGGTVTFELFANDLSCSVVTSQVNYTVAGATSLNAGSLLSTICGSDPLKMNPAASSEKGVWSTTGTGYFASGGPGTKTSQIMNDLYIPGDGEYGSVTFILSTLPGTTNTCLNPTPSIATAFLSNGINVNSGVNQFISICYNYNPPLAGTIIGTNTARWRSTGTGYFESTTTPGPPSFVTTTLVSNVTSVVSISGTSVTATGYVFNDVYVPSDTDKSSDKVIIYLESQNDGLTQCKLFSKDSLTIYFTKPPTAEAGGDKSVCSTDVIANGITISGLVTMPSPNSKLPGQLPSNAARWQVLTVTGSPLSSIPGVFLSSKNAGNANATTTGIGQFTVTSVTGQSNVKFNADDVYFPSILDTITSPHAGYRTLILALIADNVTIAGINTLTSANIPILCNPIISTKQITFIPPAYATVTNFTSTGICTDQTEIRIQARYERASGLIWTTTGDGLIVRNNNDNTDISYELSANDLSATNPQTILFSPTPIGAANGCIAPIANVVTVTVNPRPVMSITGSGQTICADNQAVTFTGYSVNTFPGSWPSAYQWVSNGSGNVLGASSGNITQTGGNLSIPFVYKISTGDASSQPIAFLFSHTGPNTCLPKVINNVFLNINPLPVIIPTPAIARCRDNTQIPISVQSIQNVSTVQWVVSRRDVGSLTFTVLGVSSNPGTLTGGSLAQTTNGSLLGDNLNAASIVYFTSSQDRATAAELLFTIYSVTNDPNTSLPACNQVSAQISVTLTDAPVVSITSSLSSSGICSNTLFDVPLNGSISGFGNLSGIWTSNGFGTFNPTNAINAADLAANAYSYALADQDRNFTTLGLTLSVTGTGTCVNAYSSTANITITPAPELNAGGNDSVCADSKTIPLLNSTQKNGSSFKWITFGTGTFSGSPSTNPSAYSYFPSSQDSALGAVTIALIVPNIVTCLPDTSFKTIRFSTPPIVEAISSGISSQNWCSDNAIPLSALVDNRASKWFWSAIKTTLIGVNQQFSTIVGVAGVRGSFLDDNGDVSTNALTGSYVPSREDTLGANRNNANQVVILRLSANGIGVCALRTFTSDINVTLTPRPNISLSGVNNICTNDMRPITLTAYFLNTVAGIGQWSSSGTNSTAKFSNLFSPNPPTVAGTVYSFDKTDPSTLTFEFKPDDMGTCKSAILQGSSRNVISVKFTPGPVFSPVAYDPYCANVINISLVGISVNTVVGRVQWITGGTGIFASSNNTITGVSTLVGTGVQSKTIGQIYTPSDADKAQKQVSLFVYSAPANDNCPPDTAKLSLRFDDIPIVTVATDSSSVCAGQVITLTGSVINHKAGIWSTVGNSGGYAGNGFITPATTTLGTIAYTMSNEDATQSSLRFVLTSLQDNKCAPASDTATINLFAKPTASAGAPSVCTIAGIQLSGTATNTSQTVWTTTGKGVFSPSIYASNAIYVPDSSDIKLGNVTLKFTALGQGPCDETSSTIFLPLKANPLPKADAGKDEVVCGGNEFRLNVANILPGNTYQWYIPTILGGNAILATFPGSGKNITAVNVPVDSGNYSVYVLQVIDNTLGCVNTDTVKLKSLTLPSLAMPPKVCYQDQLILSVGVSFTNREGVFQWYRDNQYQLGETNPDRIEVNVNRGEFVTYTVEYTENGTLCTVSESTLIRPLPILNTKGKVVCLNDQFSMTPTVIPINFIKTDSVYTYKWDASYIQTIIGERFDIGTENFRTITGVTLARDSSKYLVMVTDITDQLGCTAYDTVRVKTHPVPDIYMPDVAACIGDVVTLDATPTNLVSPITIKYPPGNDSTVFKASYTWIPLGRGILDTSQISVPKIRLNYENNGSSLYQVTFQIGECIRTDSSLVQFENKPFASNSPDVPYCIDLQKGIELIADSSTTSQYRYLWLASGNTTRTEVVFDTLKYYVRISNPTGCAYIDSIQVRSSCDPLVFIPEALIPEGPNPKDHFFSVFGKYFDNPELTVFNRWGEIVFYSKDKNFIMNNGWDGNFAGSILPTGVYPYIFNCTGLYKEQIGKPCGKRGSVTIIR